MPGKNITFTLAPGNFMNITSSDIPTSSNALNFNTLSNDCSDTNPYDDPNQPPARRTLVEVSECHDQPEEYFCSIPHCILRVFDEDVYNWKEEPIASGSVCLFNPEPGKLIMQMSRRDHINNLRFEFYHHSAFWLDGTEHLMFKTSKFGICILLCSTKGEVARIHRFFMSLRIGSIEAAKIEDEKYRQQKQNLNTVKKNGISVFNELFPHIERKDASASEAGEYSSRNLANGVQSSSEMKSHRTRSKSKSNNSNGKRSPQSRKNSPITVVKTSTSARNSPYPGRRSPVTQHFPVVYSKTNELSRTKNKYSSEDKNDNNFNASLNQPEKTNANTSSKNIDNKSNDWVNNLYPNAGTLDQQKTEYSTNLFSLLKGKNKTSGDLKNNPNYSTDSAQVSKINSETECPSNLTGLKKNENLNSISDSDNNPDPVVFDLNALKNLKINKPRLMQGPKFLRKC